MEQIIFSVWLEMLYSYSGLVIFFFNNYYQIVMIIMVKHIFFHSFW